METVKISDSSLKSGNVDLDGAGNPKRIWEPLNFQRNEFRLLQPLYVSTNSGEQVIDALVINFALNDPPPYVALSYAWGNGEARFKIMLNGVPHLITDHLRQALLVLLAQGKTHVWVDALCIRQDDPDEKASQVQRMATVFQEAETVIIWLGVGSSQ
ncbi:hypothetical protein H2200_006270 [Cladophialophora chaetospira]|uniref:Heterokaryon incompatibility domain-containing protein n=1 Tax=Cladophialophora chaetospira TaxID=386627 RepID=A0AA38XAR6_9EURO|nr:hypothetical protein H2200_006270 [Cladophialophora chaetospira]